jgi:hypothetical protein
MRNLWLIATVVVALLPGKAWANRYYFCVAYVSSGPKSTNVIGGVAVTRDGYRQGESRRIMSDFEARLRRNYDRVGTATCYDDVSEQSTRKLIANYFQKGTVYDTIDFNVDYTGGVPSGSGTSREPGVYFVPPTVSAPATQPKPRSDGLSEAEIQRRNAAADADLATANASYQRQRALQEAEYRRVAEENANRQAAYRARIAKQQADYQAMIAARDAQAAQARAEWEARVARCKGGDKKSCGGQAIER